MDRIREYMRLCEIQVGKTPAVILGSWDDYTGDDTGDDDRLELVHIHGSHEQHASGTFIPQDKKVMIV